MQPMNQNLNASGFSAPVRDAAARALDLNELLVHHPAATFFMRCGSDVMRAAGIAQNDLLVCDRSLTLQNDDVAIFLYNGEFIIRRVTLESERIILSAPDKRVKVLVFAPTELPECYGVVTAHVHLRRNANALLPKE